MLAYFLTVCNIFLYCVVTAVVSNCTQWLNNIEERFMSVWRSFECYGMLRTEKAKAYLKRKKNIRLYNLACSKTPETKHSGALWNTRNTPRTDLELLIR